MADFLSELNACVVPPADLTCGEYCFRHYVNHFQHPCLDRNIHHLTALLTALSNTCGGVVHLNSAEQHALQQEKFSLFKTRLYHYLVFAKASLRYLSVNMALHGLW